MRAFLFPGQGSQVVGMGSALIDASPAARAVWEEVDETLDLPLTRIMRDGPADELTLTANAQPAIMANALATLRAGGVSVNGAAFVAGHSLGEYTALCAADSFDIATTARLLRLRGEAMQAAVPVGEGAMAALLGGSLEDARTLAEAAADGHVCVVANDNDPTQVVLSGHVGAVERAIGLAKEHGFRRAVSLPVSAPFHSPLMAPAAEAMHVALAEHPPRDPIGAAAGQRHRRSRSRLRRRSPGCWWSRSPAPSAGARACWRSPPPGVTEVVEVGAKVLGPMVKRTVPEIAVVEPGDAGGPGGVRLTSSLPFRGASGKQRPTLFRTVRWTVRPDAGWERGTVERLGAMPADCVPLSLAACAALPLP